MQIPPQPTISEWESHDRDVKQSKRSHNPSKGQYEEMTTG